MKKAKTPLNEAQRLEVLEQLNIVDSIGEQEYDDLTLLAAMICDVPVSLVSLVTADRQWFKSHHGIEATETPRELAFCSHAILEDEILYIPDSEKDPRFSDNPLVTGAPFVKFYAGVPLVTEGVKVGTLCVIDHNAHSLSESQINGLKALARQVESHLETRFELAMAKKNEEENSKNLFQITDKLESRVLMERTQEAAKIGSWQVDIKTNQTKWSKMTYEIHELDEQVKLKVEEGINFYIPEHRPIVEKLVNDGIESKEGWDAQLQIETAKKNLKWVRTIGYPVFKDGELIRLEGVFQDINDMVINQQLLSEEKNKAEQALAAKSTFLANMSHEIRTPLNGIIGFTSLMLEQDLPEKTHEQVQHIQNCGDGLLMLINDILDLSKVEAGKMSFERIPFNFNELIKSTLVTFEPIVKTKDLKLLYEIDPSVSNDIYGDPLRIRQIIFNLVGNAIKFTSSGSVVVRVNLKNETTAKTKVIEVEIEDTGIGIPSSAHKNLFQSFEQVDSSTSRKFGGTGLGLAICESLVEMMGGTLSFSSQEEVGSIFRFDFATEFVSNLSPMEKEKKFVLKTEPLELVKIMPVLVVEDNKLNSILLKKILEKIGYEAIDFAENGIEAIELVRKKSYKVIFMDVQMPIMDGNDATKIIREELDGDVYIVGVSANSFPEDRLKALQSGMDEYVEKPVKYKVIEEILKVFGGKNISKVC